MEIKFIANKVVCETNTEEDYYLIGFSDNGNEPFQYVILQRAINFDQQDIELGMNTYYFEYSDQSNSGYGICKNIIIKNGYVLFELKEKILDNIQSIEITFKEEALENSWMEFKTIFDKIISTE